MGYLSDRPTESRAMLFWQDMRRPGKQALAIICIGVWIRVYLIVADAVANCLCVRAAFQSLFQKPQAACFGRCPSNRKRWLTETATGSSRRR
jgi:hypothetical protein